MSAQLGFVLAVAVEARVGGRPEGGGRRALYLSGIWERGYWFGYGLDALTGGSEMGLSGAEVGGLRW